VSNFKFDLFDFVNYIRICNLKKKGLQIGRNVQINLTARIDNFAHLVTIGDNVILSSGVAILAHDTILCKNGGEMLRARVKIGNNTFIGANSTILPGVTIGANVVIGAGSVVTQDIPSGVVVAGNPAKVIKSMDALVKERSFLATKHVE
jgi:maltose O-acetyltransferase